MLQWLRADRPRTFATAVGLVLLISASVWFFTARDDRGKTSRLTADAWYYHAYLPSLAYDRDVDFRDEYGITKNWYRLADAPTGKPSNVFGIGPAVFEMPLFLTGAAVTAISGGGANGFSTAEVKLSLYASLLFSLAALFFVWRIARRRLGADYLAVIAPVLLACAGPVVYYAIRQPGYAHPFATFWTAWLIDAWDRSYLGIEPRRWRTWAVLGTLLGCAVLARPQLGLWTILVAMAAVDDLLRHRRAGTGLATALRAQAPAWALGAALCLVCALPQLLAWKSIYGELVLTPQGAGFMRWDAPAWSEVLFSSRNGLLPWAPLYAAALIGLLMLAVRLPRLGVALVIGVMLQTLANGAAWDWWAGGSFGGRRFDSCFAAFALGLVTLLAVPVRADESVRRRRIRVGWAVAGGVLAGLLAIGNLIVASKTSAPSARIYGGQAAHVVLSKQVGNPLGGLVAAASRASNWPARQVFAWRHGTSAATYDYVVGHHALGELYPGLNSFKGKTRERLRLADVRRKLVGMRIEGGRAVLSGRSGTVLVGLNRHGPVGVSAHAVAPGGAVMATMRVNGREIARATVGPHGAVLVGVASDVERGVNEIEFEADGPGLALEWIELTADHDLPPSPR